MVDFDQVKSELEPKKTDHNRTPADALNQQASTDAEYSTRAIIGEAAVPTKYSADDAAIGARMLMEANNYTDNLEEFFILDGLSTQYPNRSGKRLLNYLNKFGVSDEIDNAESYEEIRYILEEISEEDGADELELLDENEEALKHLANSKSDIILKNREFLNNLLPEGDYDIVYTGGEAEDYNLSEEREKDLHRLKRKIEEEIEGVDQEREDLVDEIEDDYDVNDPDDLVEAVHQLSEKFQEMNTNYDDAVEKLNNIHNRLSGHWKNAAEPEPEAFVDGLNLEQLESEVGEIYAEDIAKLFDVEDKTYEQYREEYEETRQEWDSILDVIEDDVEFYDLKLADLEDELDRIGIQADQPDVARWFGQISNTSPIEAVTLSLLAKDEIKDDVLTSFPKEYRDQLEISLDRIYSKTSEGDSKDQTTSKTVESPLGDVDIVHNNMWTNVSSEYSLMRLVDEYKRRKEMGEELPDTVLIPHAAGGFESIPYNMKKATREVEQPGEWLEDPDYNGEIGEEMDDVRFMNLPKFLDLEEIKNSYDKGEKTDEAKNYYKSWMQTGMVFQHKMQTDEGLIEVNEHVPERYLAEIGERTRELLDLDDGSLDEVIQDLGNPTGTEGSPEKLLTDVADEHVGHIEFNERPSNRQKVQAWTNSINKYLSGDLDKGIIYGGDLVHGNVSWGADRNTNNGESNEVIRDAIAEEIDELDYEDLTDEDLKQLLKNSIARYSRNMERSPLPNASKQEKVVRDQIMQIEEEFAPDFRVNVTGNHYHTLMGSEETDYMREAQIAATGDPDPERYELDAMGSLEGGFGNIYPFDNELDIFVQHKDKGGTHHIKQSREMSMDKDTGADVEVYHHDHMPSLNVVHGKTIWGPGATESSTIRGEVSGYGHHNWPQQSLLIKGDGENARGWISEVTVPHETLSNLTEDELDEALENIMS